MFFHPSGVGVGMKLKVRGVLNAKPAMDDHEIHRRQLLRNIFD
jgi:hypothetical protein